MQTAEMLRRTLEHTDKSKNTIIRETRIDRSTFYKILSGERHATQEQMVAILGAMEPTAARRRRLIDCYEREQAGEECYHARQTVCEFINGLSQEVETPPIEDVVQRLVQENMAAGERHYDAYLPIGSRYMSMLLGILAESAGDGMTPEIQSIVAQEAPTGRETEVDRIYREIGIWYRYLRSETLRFHAYEPQGRVNGAVVTPFPYYILSGGTLLMISADESRCVVTREPAIVAGYEENHRAQCAEGQEIASTETGYEPILQFITGLWQTAGQTEIYLLTPRPCLWLCSDDDLVRRYMHDEQFVQYGQMYRSLNLREFTTHSGMEQFLAEGRIAEAGFNIPVSPEDVATVRANIERNTGVRTFYLNEERIHLPQDWQLFLVAHKASIFIPYQTSSYMMCSTSSTVVEPLTEWCRSRCRELNNDILQ